jgi:hypothetical protein
VARINVLASGGIFVFGGGNARCGIAPNQVEIGLICTTFTRSTHFIGGH